MSKMRTIIDAVWGEETEDSRIFCHFVQGGRELEIRYGDLRRESARYAAFIRSEGIQPGEVVVVILRHCPDLLYAFLGAMLAEAIPTFMPCVTSKQDPDLYWQSHAKLFSRIAVGGLITDGESHSAIRQNIPELSLRLLNAEASRTCEPAFATPAPNDENIAFLQHSSGTTGLKKGVALSHKAVLKQVESYTKALGLSAHDRIVSWLPLYHDMGLIACFMLPLITRTPVVYLDPFEWVVNPGSLFDAIRRHRGTLCWQPNFAFHHLCRTVRPSGADVSSIRAWIDCSEPCRAETVELFVSRFASAGVRREQFQVCYAMAETVFAITQTVLGKAPSVLHLDAGAAATQAIARIVSEREGSRQALSAGRPIAGLRLQIVDHNRQPQADRHIGEIAISGDCLFSGYYKLPAATEQKLANGWYFSGDLGFLHEGELFVTGRKNDLIIVHGRNYYAHELEYLVNQTPGVHPGRNVAVGWFRPELGSEEVVVLAESDDSARSSQLTREIKQALLTQAGLQVFDVLVVPPGWLIKTTSGKISRTENLNKYLSTLSKPNVASAA